MPSSRRVAADHDPVTDAMDRHAWSEAAAILEQTPDPSGDDLARLASCAWWLGDIDRCIDLRERAFRAFLDAGRKSDAAAVAILLVEDHYHKLQDATGRSWLRRAEQLVTERPGSVEAGWLARFRAMTAIERDGDPEAAILHAAEAMEVAHRAGDRNLLAIAQHDHGRALVMTGRVEEGLSHGGSGSGRGGRRPLAADHRQGLLHHDRRLRAAHRLPAGGSMGRRRPTLV